MTTRSLVHLAALAALLGTAAAPATFAHEGDDASTSSAATTNPATLVQLASVQRATARFLDEQAAIDAGYVDISLFYPKMGHHYLNADLLDATIDLENPEILVYADDLCGGSRRLVAVEYAVPVSLVKDAPTGFAGTDDTWVINQQFQLWTLHAWLFEYNPGGVFAAYNVRMP